MCTANRLGILGVLVVLILIGCTRGMLFTNITTPYTKNFISKDSTGTPVGGKACVINDYLVKYPTFSALSAEWTDNSILREAKKVGINNIYYIDMKTLSILGIFQKKDYIIYGD